MPHYRRLWTKITTSEDVQAMPNDTMRLAWTLLPLALDGAGRGLYNGAWLRAKLFPLREDIENTQARTMLDWWRDHGMVVAYTVDGREYFTVPTWVAYQGDCSREAVSEIPPPNNDLVTTYSRSTLEPVLRRSRIQAEAEAETESKAEAKATTAGTRQTGAPAPNLPAAADSSDGNGDVNPETMAVLRRVQMGEPGLSEMARVLTPVQAEAWIAEVQAQPGLNNPAGYILKRWRSGATPRGSPSRRERYASNPAVQT